MDEITELLGNIFFQSARSETSRVMNSDVQLVHYTSASAAMSILDPKEPAIWLRSTRCMNDRQEVDGGIARINSVMSERSIVDRLWLALNNCHDNMALDVSKLLDETMPTLPYATWITCLSEHPRKEDRSGRLSMWRGYGGNDTGVAIVLDKKFLVSTSVEGLRVFASPAFYRDDTELRNRITSMIDAIEANCSKLQTIDPHRIAHCVRMMLAFAAVSIKHPGFDEEREWRLVYLPTIFSSPAIVEERLTFRGVPQKVFKVPLADQPEHGISGITPNDLVKKIILGPSQFADTIAAAFAGQLHDLGVTEPWSKIQISDIPLRV
ncbi:MAG: DUF2971 domain-containing protein [Alphaproteobacteria bacterium]|nr:DUF2971 domain-containing protein [Alphaproteobacteria bacterium]MBU1560941.1 DUF2971 domain-containing protein [Alphaproteobacteria bacterium]MBU2304915.1 DUF2971 domain-containing protein [Alphaproteobacteria bacterium]MBU2370166.1 DUF2971 domain-containing protein [Alphaproteobacteria bacterium]